MRKHGKKTVGVLLVEDDDRVRERLSRRIDDIAGLEVIAAAANLAEGRRAFEQHAPDVFLCDLGLPDGDGTELIREQAAKSPALPILVISMFGDEEHVIRAIEAGASGYLLKDDDPDAIESVINQLLDGGSPISSAIARHLVRRFQTPATESTVKLGARELEVLGLASKGFTNREIAGMLNVSANTVGSYTKRIYEKLAVGSRTEAVYEANRMGLLDERRPR